MVSTQWLVQPLQRVMEVVYFKFRILSRGSMVRAPSEASIPLPGDEGRAEGAHDAGNVRPDGVAAGDFLKAAEHGVVVEGSALYHHVFSQIGGGGDFDHLKQSVLDDGVGQTGGDIRHGRSLLLSLLYVGVHEHGAPGAQVRGVFGKQSLLREILHAVI